MVVQVSSPGRCDLKWHMAVTQVITNSGQQMRGRGRDVTDGFRSGHHTNQLSAIGCQMIAASQGVAALNLNQRLGIIGQDDPLATFDALVDAR